MERVVLGRVERDFGGGLARFFGQEEGRVGELFGFAGGFARAPFFRSFAVVFVSVRGSVEYWVRSEEPFAPK